MSTELDAKIAALSEEIRRYPTPIARCDEQLAGLLEHRARLIAERERISKRKVDTGCTPESIWINDGGINAA